MKRTKNNEKTKTTKTKTTTTKNKKKTDNNMKKENAYKEEVLNWIETGKFVYDEDMK